MSTIGHLCDKPRFKRVYSAKLNPDRQHDMLHVRHEIGDVIHVMNCVLRKPSMEPRSSAERIKPVNKNATFARRHVHDIPAAPGSISEWIVGNKPSCTDASVRDAGKA